MQMELPAIRPPELSDFTITWRTRKDGDLANLMSVKVEEEEPRLMLKKGAPVLEPLPHEAYPAKTEIYRNKNAQTKLRALIYRDSFTTALIPLLAENFYEIVLIWDTDYSLDMVNKVKPDVVIECYASRYFR